MAAKHIDDLELKNFMRFSDVSEEPLLIYAPINGYEQMPIVTLEDAIEPLLSIVPNVKQMLCIIKERSCQEIKDGLTTNESASIMLYSMEWEPKENSLNLILNKTLRNENRDELKPWFLYLKLFMKSLSKLPSIHCYVYRGIQIDLSTFYPQGKTFIWWAFSLCSRSIEILENEHDLNKTIERTRFKIECKSAKDIRNHSFHKTDDEILLLPAQRYKVISSLHSTNGLHIIQVKEIDPYPISQSIINDRTSSLSLTLSQQKSSINISIRDASLCSVVLKLTGTSSTYHNPHLEDLLRLCKTNSWIDLSVRELIDQDMSIIIQRAIIDKKCKGLYLTGNKISNESISILADALYNNFTLVELDLSDNHITDDGVKILMDVLVKNKSILAKLHLGSNNITDQGIQYLSEMLKTNRSLTHLMLNRNHISNHGIHILSNVLALHNISLEVLSLASNNLITDSSIDSLIIMLKQNETLKGLDIKYCNISEASNQRLRQLKLPTSSHNNRALEQFIDQCDSSNMNLSHKKIIDQDMSMIVHLGIIEKKCIELKLGYNDITSDGIEILANALQNNTTLEKLNLFNNKISDQGVDYLTRILSLNNSYLKMLFLGQNQITDKGIQHLSEMLKTNQRLTHLGLSNNEISDQGIILLADTLANHNTTLKELYLWGNKLISDTCIDALANMLVYNRTITKLVLFDCNLSEISKARLQEVGQPRQNFGLFL